MWNKKTTSGKAKKILDKAEVKLMELTKQCASKISHFASTHKTKQAIEINALSSCPVMCSYCPQKVLKKATKLNPIHMSYETYAESIASAINSTKKPIEIHWTGYSEPLLNDSFIEMCELAASYKIKQEISTTLVGLSKNINYLATTKSLYLIVLHLPDGDGMMQNGILKVNKEYIVRLRNFLSVRLDSPNTPIRVICFGSTLHPSVREVLSEFDDSPALKVPAPLLSLSSRCGSVEKAEIQSISKSNTKLKYSISIIRSALRQLKLPVYMCKDKKIFQPVLLGNSYMNICGNDYTLSMQRGPLVSNTLTKIDNNWWDQVGSEFAGGKLEPCTSCENYVKVDLWTILSEIKAYTKLLIGSALSLKSNKQYWRKTNKISS